ncbi:uncharacterized protein drl isoform X2 [Eurosta solidaginis]|uniref:uncharacterized protein drl isoform X2 n=1 Tax=Eurosta solidaginis TaxID=178769 RepID=UPI0035309355
MKRSVYNEVSKQKKECEQSAENYKRLCSFAEMESEKSGAFAITPNYCPENSFSFSDSDPCSENENEFRPSLDTKFKILKSWAMECNICQSHISKLLVALNKMGYNEFPLCAQTLFQTSISNLVVKNISGGEFAYFGIQAYFESKSFPCLNEKDEVLIDVGIDGLNVFNSSKKVLWPILGSIADFPKEPLFTIACFSWKQKPLNVNDFMEEFCNEVVLLRKNGLKVGLGHPVSKKFDYRLFICDSSARAFITGVKNHNAYNGCPKCCQVGKTLNKTVCFCKDSSVLRTDFSFKNRNDQAHHSLSFREEGNVLEAANFGMVSQFPLDPMHLVDLGVAKKLLGLLFNNSNISIMNDKFNLVFAWVPSEFGRNCRHFNNMKIWKSTEYRQFLLYSGIFILKDCVDNDLYYHFLLLHTSIRILSSEKSYLSENNAAQQLLSEFVNLFGDIYGDHKISFNIHGLLHLADCAKEIGPLDSFSAYKFENYMQHLKKLIKSPTNILQQLYLRLEERKSLIEEKKSKFDSFIINPKKEKDSFCYNRDTGPFKVTDIRMELGEELAIGYNFKEISSYFSEPVESFPALGILLASGLSEQPLQIPKRNIEYKYFCIPFQSSYILIPILHHLFHEFVN